MEDKSSIMFQSSVNNSFFKSPDFIKDKEHQLNISKINYSGSEIVEKESINNLFEVKKKSDEKEKEKEISNCVGPCVSIANNNLDIQPPISSLESEEVILNLGSLENKNISNSNDSKNIKKPKDESINIKKEEEATSRINELNSNRNTGSNKYFKRLTLVKTKLDEANSYYSGYKSAQNSRSTYWPNDSLDILRIRKQSLKEVKEFENDNCACKCVIF